MKVKNMVGIIFCSLLVTQLNAMMTYSFKDLPQGNYQWTCRNIKMEIKGMGFDLNRVISADCQDAQGKWKKSTITVPVITNAMSDVVLINDNGKLKIAQ